MTKKIPINYKYKNEQEVKDAENKWKSYITLSNFLIAVMIMALFAFAGSPIGGLPVAILVTYLVGRYREKNQK